LPRVKAAAELIGMLVRLYSGDRGNWSEDAERVAREAIDALRSEEAHDELANAHRLLALALQNGGRLAQAAEEIRQVIEHARKAGNDRLVARSGLGMSLSALFGPTPVPQAIEQCEGILAGGLKDRQVESVIRCRLAQLRAMNGEFEAARALYRAARATLRELGQGLHAASTGLDVVIVELLAGDAAAAEREARADYDFLKERGETFFLSTMAALLARAVREQGRDEEALALSQEAEAAAAAHDLDAQVRWRSARAPILARAGRSEEAEQLARAAIELAGKTGAPSLQAETLFGLAIVQQAAGQSEEARKTLSEARAVAGSKGDQASLARMGDWESKFLPQ